MQTSFVEMDFGTTKLDKEGCILLALSSTRQASAELRTLRAGIPMKPRRMSLFADGKPVEIPNFTEATRPRSSDRVTLTARTLNSMCVEPFLVFEQRAKQQRNLPMMISFGTGRKRTGMAQNVAPMLKKFRFVVERLV
jgi:hypothetical protein